MKPRNCVFGEQVAAAVAAQQQPALGSGRLLLPQRLGHRLADRQSGGAPRRRPGRSIDDQLVRSLPPSWKENAEKIPTPSPIRFLAINKRLFEKIGIIFFPLDKSVNNLPLKMAWGIHFFRLSHFRCLSDCCLYLRKKRKRNVIMPSAVESPTENCHWNMKIGRKNRFSKACFKKSLMVWSVEAHLKIASHFVPIIPFSGFLIKSCVPISSFE